MTLLIYFRIILMYLYKQIFVNAYWGSNYTKYRLYILKVVLQTFTLFKQCLEYCLKNDIFNTFYNLSKCIKQNTLSTID